MVPDAVNLELVKRALVIKLRHHGDVLLASPVISALKARAPQVSIDALVYADTAPMLAGHPGISELHCIDREWKRRGLAIQLPAELRLLRALGRARYDLLLHLTESRRGAFLARWLRPRYAVARQMAGWWWRGSFTHTYALPAHALRHTVEKDLDALRRVGIHPCGDERRLVLVPSAEAQARVEALCATHGLTRRGFLHLHPTSRWMFKSWPEQRVAELIDGLCKSGHRLVLTAAPAAREKAMVSRILALCKTSVVDLCGALTLPELAALTARARLFIGVDSAPMHIAASQGTPVVALFGPSGEAEWGPWMVPHRVVAMPEFTCRPCGLDGCGGGKISECLTELPVTRVQAAVQDLLAETASAQPKALHLTHLLNTIAVA